MKITKEADRDFAFVGEWECTNCGCKWELDASDKDKVKLNSDQRDGDYYSMPCPSCRENTTRAVPKDKRYRRDFNENYSDCNRSSRDSRVR